jgi:hypothetical protein
VSVRPSAATFRWLLSAGAVVGILVALFVGEAVPAVDRWRVVVLPLAFAGVLAAVVDLARLGVLEWRRASVDPRAYLRPLALLGSALILAALATGFRT